MTPGGMSWCSQVVPSLVVPPSKMSLPTASQSLAVAHPSLSGSSGGSTRDAGSDLETVGGQERPCETGAFVGSAVGVEARTNPDLGPGEEP